MRNERCRLPGVEHEAAQRAKENIALEPGFILDKVAANRTHSELFVDGIGFDVLIKIVRGSSTEPRTAQASRIAATGKRTRGFERREMPHRCATIAPVQSEK